MQGIRNPDTRETWHRHEILVMRRIGQAYLRSYTLEEPWEVVPGTWTFELWYQDRKLAEQNFILDLPCINGCDLKVPKTACKEVSVDLTSSRSYARFPIFLNKSTRWNHSSSRTLTD